MRASTSSSSGAENSNKKFKGVAKQNRRWATSVYVKMNDKTRIEDFENVRNPIHIGTYDSFEKAAKAYDAAALCVFVPKPDEPIKLNFPDNPPQIFYPEGQLLTVAEVKKRANRHANIEPIQPAQEPEGNDGIAMEKPPSPVSAPPPNNLMQPPESAPVPEVHEQANQLANIEPIQPSQDQETQGNDGIAMEKPLSPVSAPPPNNFMRLPESAPVPEVQEKANQHANIEPIQPSQDQETQENDGIAMEKPSSPVSARPPGGRYFNFMDLPESAPVPDVVDHTHASPVSPFPAGKSFHNFLGVEETAPEPKVLNNAEQQNDDSSP